MEEPSTLESLGYLLLLVVITGLLFAPVILWYLIKAIRQGTLRIRYRRLPAVYQQPLQQYFHYYRELPAKDQREFEQRVLRFIDQKEFIGRGQIEITHTMKALIAGTAVMLTFGLRPIVLSHFDKILIYPNDYYSHINQQYHRGEVNPRFGLVVLSWRRFLEGFQNPTDGRNLGIHEFAHAIHLENTIRNDEQDFLHTDLLHFFETHSKREIALMRSGEPHLFRAYASTNEDEFFAVALENFFERPHSFAEHLPFLYNTLTQLLQQDPRTFMPDEG